MHGHYILIGQTPVPCHDTLEWARWFEPGGNRIVKQEHALLCWVSSVFLGLDHSWNDGPPLIFETMAFWPGEGGAEQTRCSTWEQAEEMHRAMVRWVTSPAGVWDYVCRAVQLYFYEARNDWGNLWHRLKGEPRTEMEAMLDLMKERRPSVE